jgi:hypothetical protein
MFGYLRFEVVQSGLVRFRQNPSGLEGIEVDLILYKSKYTPIHSYTGSEFHLFPFSFVFLTHTSLFSEIPVEMVLPQFSIWLIYGFTSV